MPRRSVTEYFFGAMSAHMDPTSKTWKKEKKNKKEEEEEEEKTEKKKILNT